MTLQDLQQSIGQLSVEDRLVLLNQITQSLQRDLKPQPPQRHEAAQRVIVEEMRGLLKQSREPAPTGSSYCLVP